jgi:hypothetical protein
MPTATTVSEVLDREFLGVRARLIDVAAALDRLDRVQGPAAADPRLQTIRQALQALAGDAPDRAERVQLLFSLPYDEHWRGEIALEPKS